MDPEVYLNPASAIHTPEKKLTHYWRMQSYNLIPYKSPLPSKKPHSLHTTHVLTVVWASEINISTLLGLLADLKQTSSLSL